VAVTVAALTILLSIAVWQVARSGWPRRAPPPLAPMNPAPAISVEEARRVILSLLESEDHLRGVPIARDVAARLGSPAWEFEVCFASLLHNAALQAGTRSSYERVAMMRESLAELDRAEALIRDSRDLAEVLEMRARELGVWGFQWETLMELMRAQSADPSSAAIAERAFRYRDLLRDPTSPGPP
jgi:hypothetical protein